MAVLSATDTDKITKLLALTASDFDGEALAAIRAAGRLLRDRGLTWPDIVKPDAAPQLPVPRTSRRHARMPTVLRDWPARWHEGRALAVARMDRPEITDWERRFIRNTWDRIWLTDQQLDVLRSIVVKVAS